MNRKLAALLGGAALAVAGLTAAPAMASSAAPPPPVGQFYLCLTSDHSECVVGHGQGVPATIQASGWTSFNSAACGSGARGSGFANQSGNFIRALSDQNVAIGTTCGGADYNAQWISQPGGYLKNASFGTLMSTGSDTNGATVAVGKSWRIVPVAT